LPLGTALASLAGVLYSLMFEFQASKGMELDHHRDSCGGFWRIGQ